MDREIISCFRPKMRLTCYLPLKIEFVGENNQFQFLVYLMRSTIVRANRLLDFGEIAFFIFWRNGPLIFWRSGLFYILERWPFICWRSGLFIFGRSGLLYFGKVAVYILERWPFIFRRSGLLYFGEVAFYILKKSPCTLVAFIYFGDSCFESAPPGSFVSPWCFIN